MPIRLERTNGEYLLSEPRHAHILRHREAYYKPAEFLVIDNLRVGDAMHVPSGSRLFAIYNNDSGEHVGDITTKETGKQ